MEMLKVESSNVREIGYENGTLYVVYSAGTYMYHNVPEELFEGLKNADSKGRFMNENIKGRYTYSKCVKQN